MARARNIKPGFYKNEDLAECSVWARLLFPGLWMLADREGRLENRPKRIKGEIFPYDSIEVDPLLQELEQWGFIRRYVSDGKNVISIVHFLDHQFPHGKESDSEFPDENGAYTVHERDPKNGCVTGKSNKNSADTVLAHDKHSADTVLAHPESGLLNPESGLLNPESGKKNITPTASPPCSKSTPAAELLADYGIDGDLAKDFIAHRKGKKAAITKTVLDGFQRESDKAGIAIADAVRVSIERGWVGFRADWHGQNSPSTIRGSPKSSAAQREASNIEAMQNFLTGTG